MKHGKEKFAVSAGPASIPVSQIVLLFGICAQVVELFAAIVSGSEGAGGEYLKSKKRR